MTRRTRRRRHGPRRKPVDVFIDNVLDILDTAISTVVCGTGAVLLAKALGMPGRGPQVEIPASAEPEIQAAWDRLSRFDAAGGAQMPDAAGDKPEGKAGRGRLRSPKAPPQPKDPEVVQLVKGEDGVYRPKEKE